MVAATVLAGGTALAEAQPLNMTLGGYYHFDTHLFSEDQDGGAANHGMVTAQDAEVNFNMRGELDNGMKIGGRIELEASNNGDQIDQHWITLEAGWGRIDLGGINSGRYNLSWTVNAPNVAHGITSGVQTEWLTFNVDAAPWGASLGAFASRRPLGSANLDASNDDQGIHYYSPRFNGFQVALSYRPGIANGGGKNIGQIDEDTTYTDAVDAAVHYTGDLGGVGVTALVGLATASAPTMATSGGFDDYQTVNAGFRLSSEGFKVGGMIADASEGFCVPANGSCDASDARSSSGTAYTFGVSYGSGPWGVSTQIHSGEVEDSIGIAGSSELDVWSVSGSYTLGSGLRLIASYQDAALSNEDGIAANGNDGDSFSIGVAAGF